MVCLSRPCHFKFFKSCLPQVLPGPFLNTLSHMLLGQLKVFWSRESLLKTKNFFLCTNFVSFNTKSYPLTRKKMGNQIHNNFQMSHAIAIFIVFKKFMEEKLQEETICIWNTKSVYFTIAILKMSGGYVPPQAFCSPAITALLLSFFCFSCGQGASYCSFGCRYGDHTRPVGREGRANGGHCSFDWLKHIDKSWWCQTSIRGRVIKEIKNYTTNSKYYKVLFK